MGKVAQLQICLFGGKSYGKGENGLAINGNGELTIGQGEFFDLVRGGNGQWISFSCLDAVDKGKEIVSEINGGSGDDEGAKAVMNKLVPGKDKIDLGKGENGGEEIVGRVKDELLNGGTL